MKIVFDLDYTLLDTVKFKEALVVAIGADAKVFDSVYKEAVERNKGLFDPGVLFATLKERGVLTDDAAGPARERFDDVLETTEDYLYDGAKELVAALGKHPEAEVDLMTFGAKDWQQAKVERSGLAKMFKNVLYAESDKKGFIRKLGEGHDEVYVVNDNGKEMEEMHEAAPEFNYILKTGGPKAPPKDLKLPSAETIGDLVDILEQETGWELRKEMDEISRERKREGERRVVAPGEDVRGEVSMGEDKREGEPPSGIPPSSRR